MVREHVRQVLCPVAGLALDPSRSGLVANGSRGARHLPVADVPDQHVPEPVLLLALHRRRTGGPHQLLAGQLVQRLLDLAQLAASHLGHRSRPEHLADHGCVLQQALPL